MKATGNIDPKLPMDSGIKAISKLWMMVHRCCLKQPRHERLNRSCHFRLRSKYL